MCIYFIQAEQGGLIKIGYSVNPPERLYGIQMFCPIPLKILAVTKDAPKAIEYQFHFQLSRWRRYGEWFESSPEVIDFMNKNAARFEPPPPPRFDEDDFVVITGGQKRSRCKGYSKTQKGRCNNFANSNSDYCSHHKP